MQSIPLPPFATVLLGGAAGVFLLCGLILLVARGQHDERSPLAALVSFAIPAGVAAFVVLVVASIGSILLMVGKTVAVPLALVMALVILGVATVVAQSGGSQSQAH